MVEKATFGGGCFWCTEAVFKEIAGVRKVISGYAGGHTEDPTYRQVCSGNTGHAEVISLVYDPDEVTYKDLLRVFFATHNPETKNRQGPDVGSQYRSIILHHTERQKSIADEVIDELEREGIYSNIVTEVQKLETFYSAEEKHQDFFEKNPSHPYCQAHIPDKLSYLTDEFPSLKK